MTNKNESWQPKKSVLAWQCRATRVSFLGGSHTNEVNTESPPALHVAQARLAKGPRFAVDSVSYNAIAHLAGNGMHVACAGALVIIAAIHVQKIKPSSKT